MNNEYYITSPHPLEGEQHGTHQPQRYGGGNYGGQAEGKTVIDDNEAPSVSPLPIVESIGGLPEEVVTVRVELKDEIENSVPISYTITKSIEEIKLTFVKPAQNEETFINDGDELKEGSMDEDEILEEDELTDDGVGETDESDQPTKKGRIRYDRDTLMNFKTGASKLTFQGIDLIPPELVKGENAPQDHGILPRCGVNVGFTVYENRNTPMDKMGNNNRQGGFGNRQMQMSQQFGGIGAGGIIQIPPPVTLQLNPYEPIHELHTTENAWKPSLPTKRGNKIVDDTQEEEQLLVQDIVRKTREILNKLTPENFYELLEKFLTLKLEDKQERVDAFYSVVVEKGTYSAAYAKMVCRVIEKSQEGSKIFRKKILDQCQKEFQQGNTDEEALKVLATKLAEAANDAKDGIKAEIEEKKVIARRRSLGNIRFIGELYKFQILTPKIMVECVNMLLSNRDEKSLERLCKLLTTVGQILDHQLSDIKSGTWVAEPKFMENTFTKLKQLGSDNAVSSRIRFALRDVCELRDSGWKPRRDANAPKTIDEVRRLAAIREEQFKTKQMLNFYLGQPTRGSYRKIYNNQHIVGKSSW